MAYRHVFLIAVTGLLIAGCGTGQTRAAADGPDTSETPPRDPNGPPSSADDSAPPSDDAAPNSEDAPPSSDDAPPGGGGALAGLCEQLCARLEAEQCSGSDMSELCSTGCKIPAGIIPCESEAAGLFNCLLGLPTLCSTDEPTPGQGQGNGNSQE